MRISMRPQLVCFLFIFDRKENDWDLDKKSKSFQSQFDNDS